MGTKASSKQLRAKEFETVKPNPESSEVFTDFEVNAEFLLQKKLITEMLSFLKSKFDVGSLSASDIFKTHNITHNKAEDDTHRAAELLEMKLDLFAGFETPAQLIEEFNHSGRCARLTPSELDKTFLVSEVDGLKDFRNKRHDKFLCLVLLLFKSLKAQPTQVGLLVSFF